MPKPYPDPNISSAEGILDYAYTVTDGYISPLFMAASFIIIFALLKARFYKTSDSAAVASFLTLVLGSFIWALGYLQGRIIVLFLLITVASVIWSFFDSN